MAVKSKEDLLNGAKAIFGESETDEVLEFLGDISDTIDEYTAKEKEDWKTKYEENDKMWRKKYKERFFSNEPDEPDEPNEPDEPDEPKTFSDLFKTE